MIKQFWFFFKDNKYENYGKSKQIVSLFAYKRNKKSETLHVPEAGKYL